MRILCSNFRDGYIVYPISVVVVKEFCHCWCSNIVQHRESDLQEGVNSKTRDILLATI